MTLRTRMTPVEPPRAQRVTANVDATPPAPSAQPPEEGAAGVHTAPLRTERPRAVKASRGGETVSLGARLMAGLSTTTRAVVGVGLGMTLMGASHIAAADVVYAGKRAQLQQVAHTLAAQTGEPVVHVSAEKNALTQLFTRAEAGEVNVRHLILDFDGKAPPSAWEWQGWGQRFPKAFAQVQQLHVVGVDTSGPLPTAQHFPNLSSSVAFDLRAVLEPAHIAAWALEQTTKVIGGVAPAGLSAQDALVQAKVVASIAAQSAVTTRVALGGQQHTEAPPENPLSVWLREQMNPKDPKAPALSKAALEAKLKALAANGGLPDAVLGSLQMRMSDHGARVSYDAARLVFQLVEIRRAAGPERALQALQSGTVHTVRQELAIAANTMPYEQARSDIYKTAIDLGIPLSTSENLAGAGIQGKPYLVNGLGIVKSSEVNIQAIRHPKAGDGLQLTFKLGRGAGERLETFLADRGATLVDKTIVNAAPQDGRVVTAEKGDLPPAADGKAPPEMSLGAAFRLHKEGVYRLDYFADSTSKQAMRGEVQLQVYGRSDAERNANARALLTELGLDQAFGHAPSGETLEKLKALRLLAQADPRAHHDMMARIETGEAISVAQVHDALTAAEVPPAFLQQAYFAEAAPGHVSVIVPGQSEAYQRRGVLTLFHTMSNAETFAFIAADGALMSTKDRLQVGKVFRGMSSDEDMRTGGADYVFTRQVTRAMGNPRAGAMRGGAIIFKPDLLDRGDWFAYTGDNFGTTLTGDVGKRGEAVTKMARRTYDELKAKGDPSVQAEEFGVWFHRFAPSPTAHREGVYLPRPVGRHQVKETKSTSNESMFEGAAPLAQMWMFLVQTDADRDAVLKKLHELGIAEINGAPVEDVVKVRTTTFFTEEEMLQLLAPMNAIPGPKVGDGEKPSETEEDVRLQFYVRSQQKGTGLG